ncbi:AAA family ATPase [Deinococcus sp. QL22]|uniref:ATP-binding protein n=1 Tax=Deinococcus sp. QL22 TaxID=2939437 RepID=UPI00201736A2|nr:AAA family ATPase [Deinococcus sp. QL22]UQN08302.1 AAA family ATPase [Deinococcus sp. QL22]
MNGQKVAPFPTALTSLLGREQDLPRLTALLHGPTRLLTLRGPGGIGKTALALEVARTVQATFELGAVLVELAALADPADVLPAVARTLRIPLHGRTATEAIASDLQDRSILLVLDNFEQVRSAALDVKQLLDATTRLKILVTSRVALHLHDEQEYPVEPLGLPTSPRKVLSSPAVQLLLDRIRHHDPAFVLTHVDERAALQVCQSLEGIPLAFFPQAGMTALGKAVLPRLAREGVPGADVLHGQPDAQIAGDDLRTMVAAQKDGGTPLFDDVV